MKTLLLLVVCALLAVQVQAQTGKASTKATSKSLSSQPVNDITGVWTFIRNVGSRASTDKKVKIILDKHWMFSQPDPKTNLTLFHHGGTYLLDGNRYAETIEYANETTGGFIGQTFRYEVTVVGDSMTLTGVGNTPFSEVWKRVK